MSSPRVSNFYVPDQSMPKTWLRWFQPKKWPRWGYGRLHSSCWDNWRLLSQRWVFRADTRASYQCFQNHEAISEYESSKKSEFDVHLLEFDQDDPDLDANSHDRKSEAQVIYLNWTTKLSHTEIALKLDVSKQIVHAWISQHRISVRKRLKVNRRQTSANKTIFDDGLISKINWFCL